MAPLEFSVRLQAGITGGFAPPSPSYIHTITSTSQHLTINSLLRSPPSHDLIPQPNRQLPAQSYSAQIEQIYKTLKELPVEEPQGSEDIYGLDTGVTFECEGWRWSNGGPEGCGGGFSDVQVGREQKGRFGDVVRLIQEIINGS